MRKFLLMAIHLENKLFSLKAEGQIGDILKKKKKKNQKLMC